MLININILYISKLELKGGSGYGASVYSLKFKCVLHKNILTYEQICKMSSK
jgi:hypothetical protein